MTWLEWAILLVVVVMVGYRTWQRFSVANISVHEVRTRLMIREKLLLIDVRQPDEFRKGHIPGAVNIPLSDLAAKISNLARKTEVILVCRSGNRSMRAWHQLKALGFTEVKNLEGGMNRWCWDTETV